MCDVGFRGQQLEGITGLVDDLVVATVNNRIYWSGHPRVDNAVQRIRRRLADFFADSEDLSLVLGVADGYLIFRSRPLVGATMSAPRIVRAVERIHGGGIEFDRDADTPDLIALFELLGDVKGSAADCQEANRMFERKGCHHIRILPEHKYESNFRASRSATGRKGTTAFAVSMELYQSLIDSLQSMSVSICRGEAVNLARSSAHVEQIVKQLDVDRQSVLDVSRYEHFDSFTFGHSIRVCILALDFAARLTNDRDLQQRIGLAALLHDIGKAKVPFEILHAEGPLSDEERREMERHTTFGAQILLELPEADPMAVAAAFGHHRTLQGTGYPKLPYAAPMSPVTRIVKICDVFEALTAVRPYKAAMSPQRAYRIMLSMDKHFEPGLLRRFIEITGVYPDGTHVLLNTGEIACVERQSGRLERPMVRHVTTPDGDPLPLDEQQSVDLAALSPQEVWVENGPLDHEPEALATT